MSKAYSHFSISDRNFIHEHLNAGRSCSWIGQSLGRHRSSIWREVRRGGGRQNYSAPDACIRSLARRRRGLRKLCEGTQLRASVIDQLRLGWSPQQISGKLRDMASSEHVSHETIYQMLYVLPRGEVRKELLGYLRRGHKERMPRTRGKDRRGGLIDMVSIHERPSEVDERMVPGHWEGDLIKGAGNATAIGVLYERTCRFVILAAMKDCGAQAALEGFSKAFGRISPLLRKTLTYDQGKEMARHSELARKMGIDVYFCDPHSPWQRAGCENINGLIRQYFPKGTDFSLFSQCDLDKVSESLNGRPRKTLDFKTPEQVMEKLLRNHDVALQT